MVNSSKKPVAVIKVGGDMLLEQADREGLARNIRDLLEQDWHCVILHGGGPQLNALQEKHGLVPTKVDGRRVTGSKDLLVVKQALCGEVNVDLVSTLVAQGINAFGCHGASAQLIQAEKRPPMDFGEKGMIDLGEVGDVTQVNSVLINHLLHADLTPVIASLGVDKSGRVFNINADTTVAAIAASLNADLLILSTKVGGIFTDINDVDSRLPQVTPRSARRLIEDGVITDGMIPKVNEALALLDEGVSSIAICNASQEGSFINLAQGKASIGTRLLKD